MAPENPTSDSRAAAANGSWAVMRRAAREVLNAVSKCSEARLREAAAKAEVRAYQLIRDGLDTLPFIPTVENPNSTDRKAWLEPFNGFKVAFVARPPAAG